MKIQTITSLKHNNKEYSPSSILEVGKEIEKKQADDLVDLGVCIYLEEKEKKPPKTSKDK